MADISVTASAVVPGSNAVTQDYIAGAGGVTAGQPVYQQASSSTVLPADADSATAEVRTPVGIAVNTAAAGQPVKVQKSGNLTLNAALTAGRIYILSANAGMIAPHTDLTTNWYPVILGTATSATVLKMPAGGPLVGETAV